MSQPDDPESIPAELAEKARLAQYTVTRAADGTLLVQARGGATRINFHDAGTAEAYLDEVRAQQEALARGARHFVAEPPASLVALVESFEVAAAELEALKLPPEAPEHRLVDAIKSAIARWKKARLGEE